MSDQIVGSISFEEDTEKKAQSKVPLKTLYAVAYNKRIRRRKDGLWVWIPARIEYVRADDANQAKFAIISANPRYLIDIISAAPVVGYFVEDEKKVILSAS